MRLTLLLITSFACASTSLPAGPARAASPKVTASSHAKKYPPAHLLDGNGKTAWVPNPKKEGGGAGASVTFTFPQPTRLEGLAFTAGYTKRPDLFAKNNVLDAFRLRAGALERRVEVPLRQSMGERDGEPFCRHTDEAPNLSPRLLWLDDAVETKAATITVESVRRGSKWNELAVSELHPIAAGAAAPFDADTLAPALAFLRALKTPKRNTLLDKIDQSVDPGDSTLAARAEAHLRGKRKALPMLRAPLASKAVMKAAATRYLAAIEPALYAQPISVRVLDRDMRILTVLVHRLGDGEWVEHYAQLIVDSDGNLLRLQEDTYADGAPGCALVEPCHE